MRAAQQGRDGGQRAQHLAHHRVADAELRREVRKGEDTHAIERAIPALLDRRGAEYPAEHNVGHLYQAKPALRDFYRSLDPTNSFNSGIGQTSRRKHWADPTGPNA